MKHTYRISGMTCNGCRTTVEKTLNAISGITKATVSLPNSAIIEMETDITIEIMQEALSNFGNYTINATNLSDKKTDIIGEGSYCG